MPIGERLQVGFAVVIITAILAGLIARRRASSCWSFVAYLIAVAVSDLLAALWPDVFWRKWFWMLKENVHNVLKLATLYAAWAKDTGAEPERRVADLIKRRQQLSLGE